MRVASFTTQSVFTLGLVVAGTGLPAVSAWGDETVPPKHTAVSQPAEPSAGSSTEPSGEFLAGFSTESTRELSAESRDGKAKRTSVGLFEAVSERVVEVRFIPHSAKRATVQFKNVSATPLEIELPAAFAAVHVLAQPGIGGPAMGGLAAGGLAAGGQGGWGAGGGQGLGGGFGAGLGGGAGLNPGALNGAGLGGAGLGGAGLGGGGFNPVGGGGGFFRIEAGKTRKLQVSMVCLEHGKPEPNPRMTYQLVPLDRVNHDPAVIQLCQLLGQGSVPQNVAQAAAWHLANGLTWEELRRKDRYQSRYTGDVRWFNPAELESAQQIAQFCRVSLRETGVTQPRFAPDL